MAFFRRAPRDPAIEVIGPQGSLAGDWFHLMLRAPWWATFLAITGIFLVINLVFALGYLGTGGVVGARPGSFSDLFFFSVQTMGTIGYGSMYPQGMGAHVLTTCEALVNILVVALATGIFFSKFSVLRARVRFAARACIAPMNGVPTLSFRIGHERSSSVIDVLIRVVLTRTERSREGVLMYRMYDLELVRDRAPALNRAWMVMHPITEKSPLYGATPQSCITDEIELMLTLSGIDETSGQTLHARHLYTDQQVTWGARYADMLSERQDGGLVLNMNVFHDLIPTEATPSFPHPAAAPASAAPPSLAVGQLSAESGSS